jgi:hypothetical protein
MVAALGVAVTFPALGRAMSRTESRALTTHLPTTTYSANTTWTLANSPYVLDGDVTVASGVTLTVEPGVVVKLNGSSRTLTVNGTLNAVGTSSSRIVFTSYQDDAAAGDTNGDGTATSGAAGQWSSLVFSGSGSQLQYVDVRFGGAGSAPLNYGAVKVSGANASLAIDHADISYSQQSGVLVGTQASAAATIANSTLTHNVDAVGVNGGTVSVSQSNLTDNSRDGLELNMANTNPAPAAPSLTGSEVTGNGRDGVEIGANGDYPLASMPIGTGNNIYANTSKQLSVNGVPGVSERGCELARQLLGR